MKWSAVVAVHNDDAVLQSTLLRSPSLTSPGRLAIQRGFPTVAQAYNAGLQACDSDVVVFVHPDVYLPDTWEAAFARSLEYLQKYDPDWGVLGLFGVRRDGAGRGFLYSTGRHGFVGTPFLVPEEIRTVDEFVFAVRRTSGLACDASLPSAQFQLGATDLCLEAERRGMKNYVAPSFSLHNSNRWPNLPLNFWPCYLYIRSKWKKALPVELPYARITLFCGPMLKESMRHLLRFGRGSHRVITRVENPSLLYQELRRGMVASFA
jgi:glycosyltransferase involved in cell wall biosynthesis